MVGLSSGIVQREDKSYRAIRKGQTFLAIADYSMLVYYNYTLVCVWVYISEYRHCPRCGSPENAQRTIWIASYASVSYHMRRTGSIIHTRCDTRVSLPLCGHLFFCWCKCFSSGGAIYFVIIDLKTNKKK